VALEFAEATKLYARLAEELLTCRKTGSHAAYEIKLLEVDSARERCEKARHVLKALGIERRQKS
jgi:hypothetical protein